MSVLLTLALPVAGTCAVPPKVHEKVDSTFETLKDGAKAGETALKPTEAPKANDLAPNFGHDIPKVSKTQAPAGSSSAKNPSSEINHSGKVIETMSSGGYTYAQLEKEGKKTWVAFPTLETRVGETLSFTGCIDMSGFQSKTLNRKFDTIYFCGSPNVKSSTTKAPGKTSPGSAGAATSTAKNVNVEKATGANAYTVSEIFTKADKLKGKQIVVRGQVVKVSTGIMNKNWIHLQDGTGSKNDKTNDLVITSSEVPSEGDVVTASGTVAKDKDFGSGYKYNVIIEKASIKK
jgi:hypothetical protein